MDTQRGFELRQDPDQALIHFVTIGPVPGDARTCCDAEPAGWPRIRSAQPLDLFCPGCTLFLARAMAAHYSVPLFGPRGAI